MQIIERYLGKSLIINTLLVLTILIILSSLIKLISETRDIGYGHYTFSSAFYYVFLTLPTLFYSFFSIAIFLGTILSLNILAKHSELIILYANGVSLPQITWSLLRASLWLVLLASLIGEGLAPKTVRLAETRKTFLTTRGQTLTTQQGSVWIRDGHNFIYIQSILSPTYLNGVSRYQFDDHNNLLSTSFAKQIKYEKGIWNAYNTVTSLIRLKKIRSFSTQHETWPFSFSPKLLNISIIQADEMTLKQLNEYIRYRRQNHLSEKQYSLAFWKRILQPLGTWVMISLAIPFNSKHSRGGSTTLRTIVGVFVGFSFFFLNSFFGSFAIVYQWPVLLAAALPIAIFMGIALLSIRLTN